ncbi:MAG TPA: hypothetical protein VKR06_29375 [Ktedonosporobacter sp.]|nr:hypothetical protein [Ktedonosporobacter sp.]
MEKTKKYLWILHYTYVNRPETKLHPFYAVDEADVQEQVKQFLDKEGLPISEYYLQPAPEGFDIRNTSLPGIIYERRD